MADPQFTKFTRHGYKFTPTYRSWRSAIDRCYRVKDASYIRYGARGVTVCDRWRESFLAFLADMGERPAGCSIDRIDNTKGYEPGNCRWATRLEQGANMRKVLERGQVERRDRQPPRIKTHCKHGHEYTSENTLTHKIGFRFCRQCKREQNQKYYKTAIKGVT